MLWVVVHVMVKCIEGLYELWRVRELHTLTQVERHRALTTKFQKRGETQVGPPPGGSIGAWHIPPFLPRNGGTFFSFPPSQRSIGMGLTKGGSKIILRVGPW